ncbi:18611_t:CDS:1, partial [Gigaspora rosea]
FTTKVYATTITRSFVPVVYILKQIIFSYECIVSLFEHSILHVLYPLDQA